MVQRLVVYFEAIGDEYRVTMLESLRPRRLSPPANYTPAPKKLLDRPSTMQDVAEFVAEYIYSDVSICIPENDIAVITKHSLISLLVSSLQRGSL